MKKLYFITTNNYKFQRFSQTFHSDSVVLEQLSEETPEIQATTNREVAEFSASWAANKFNMPVLKEDVGIYLEGLGGFPGVYLNQIEKWIKSEGYLNLLSNSSNRKAYWEYAIAFCEPGKQPISFYTHQKGTISTEVRGEGGYFTDKIFIPEGYKKTISELLDSKEYIRDENHYTQLLKYLETK